MQQFVQIALLAAALIIGIVLIRWQGSPESTGKENVAPAANVESPAAKMLGFIESQIANQEDVKDVRCWSSVNKIQTFLSGLPVDLEANGRRVELYVEMIDDVWVECCRVADGNQIEKSALTAVLKSRFPENVTESEGDTKFDFGGRLATVAVLEEAIEDYSDTIESWRLLQSWSLRKASQNAEPKGLKNADSMFSQDALKQFRDFLVVFDIALLKSAKDVAMERKRGSVDGETMNIAFDRLRTGETEPLETE